MAAEKCRSARQRARAAISPTLGLAQFGAWRASPRQPGDGAGGG